MTKPLKIDFVSDVICPWCVIGLRSLEEALRRSADAVEAEIRFQPFELNPDMPKGGENLAERVAKKFGRSPEEMEQARAQMRARAAEVGFEMVHRPDARIYNTFDAHRLLHWAGLEGRQAALKHALFAAYFTRGESLDDPEALARAAESAGLSGEAAREVLASGRYGEAVREAERRWRLLGVNSVPSIIINGEYMISGGQPAEVFEQALRRIAREIEPADAE
jgi:predicted DsbA family dithiol-disulfide isomerase